MRDAPEKRRANKSLRCLSGGFLESLLNKWSGQETEPGGIAGSLENLGVTDEEADYYQREVEAGRSIVAVRSYGHRQETQRFSATVRGEVPRLEREGGVVVHGGGLEESSQEGES